MTHLRAAAYLRLTPTVPRPAEDRRIELKEIASARGWTVVATFSDQANPTTARSNDTGLDALLQAATRCEFDVLAVKSLSHLANTLPGLIKIVNELRSHGIDLLSCDDDIDTTVASGKSAFAAFASLAAFQHTMIRERSRLSLDCARRSGTKLGRPSNLNDSVKAAVIALRERGLSIRSIARQLRIGNATVCRLLQAATAHTPPQGSPDFGNAFRTRLRALERVGQEVLA